MTKILAIETSCDETGISIINASGTLEDFKMSVLADNLLSQIDMHKEYGGVYPTVAKREHALNITPLLIKTLQDAKMFAEEPKTLTEEKEESVRKILEREPELADTLIDFLKQTKAPKSIDAIAITNGPGLAPALWIGVNVAAVLALVWELPLIPTNHMEGHIFSALLHKEDEDNYSLLPATLPALALLISGGHPEIDLIKNFGDYELLGSTRDDAVGEAFDKVARLLGLGYPGGPEISKLARVARELAYEQEFALPRPMMHMDTLDFSFSGLKTAVLMITKRNNPLSEQQKQTLAREFEDASADVLSAKVLKALEQEDAKTIIIGGGVSANGHINTRIKETILAQHPEVKIYKPALNLTGDNALMIAVAGYFNFKNNKTTNPLTIAADSNLSLS